MENFLFEFLNADDKEISLWAMVLRGIVVFLLAIFFIKVGGKRIFSKYGAFDIVLSIVLGAILAKAIVGNAKFIPALVTCVIMILFHRILAKIAIKSHSFGNLIKGKVTLLSKDGILLQKEMYQNDITKEDILEAMREQAKSEDISKAKEIYLERDGTMSVILK